MIYVDKIKLLFEWKEVDVMDWTKLFISPDEYYRRRCKTIKKEKISKALFIFGKDVEKNKKIKDMKFRELDIICEYGLMGFNIDEAIENKDKDPSMFREYFSSIFIKSLEK